MSDKRVVQWSHGLHFGGIYGHSAFTGAIGGTELPCYEAYEHTVYPTESFLMLWLLVTQNLRPQHVGHSASFRFV
jgi:hypothetical protein